MNALKCDVCGATASGQTQIGWIRVEYGITTAVDNQGDRTLDNWWVDLCPQCGTKFKILVAHDHEPAKAESDA